LTIEAILVTGAATGFGHDIAEPLAGAGQDVFASPMAAPRLSTG